MSLMDFYDEIAELAGAPTYYESIEVQCDNCTKYLLPAEIYETRTDHGVDYNFCSHQCLSTMFNAGDGE